MMSSASLKYFLLFIAINHLTKYLLYYNLYGNGGNRMTPSDKTYNMAPDDTLCIGYDRDICKRCARFAPGKKTGKHLLFKPHGSDKRCEMQKVKQ